MACKSPQNTPDASPAAVEETTPAPEESTGPAAEEVQIGGSIDNDSFLMTFNSLELLDEYSEAGNFANPYPPEALCLDQKI